MIIVKRFAVILYICLFLSSTNGFSNELHFSDQKGNIIEKGNNYIIRLIKTPGSSIKTTEALFLVKATPKTCFNVISDFSAYPKFMPNIIKSTFISQTSNSKVYEFILKVALIKVKYTLSLESKTKDDVFFLAWKYVKGDIKNTTGSWEIKKEDSKTGFTRIRYNVLTDPGRFVPNWVTNSLSTKSIPDMIKAIRKRTLKFSQGVTHRFPAGIQ